MLSMARLLRVDLDKTKIGSVLNKKRFGIDESLLNTLSSVRRIAHNPEDLKRKGLSDDDIGVVTAFAALAGVFSPDVAVALQEASINQLDQLKSWEPGKFAETLTKAGTDPDLAAYELQRFERLKALLKTGVKSDAIRGITLDIGDGIALSAADKAKLDSAGIETLADWAELRDQVTLDQATANALDARTRLSAVYVPSAVAQRLIEQRLDSAFDLARLSDDRVKQLETLLRAAEGSITEARRMAQGWTNDVAQTLGETKISIGGPSLAGLDVLGDLVDLGPDLKCLECSPDLSGFSRFAYFVYLLRQTNKSLAELDAVLLQNLAALSPDSAREAVCQIQICIDVLSRASPQALTDNERRFYDRHLIVAKMRLLPLSFEKFAAQIAQGSAANSLAQRLRAALLAAPDAEGPAFTPAERQAISNALDQQLHEFFKQQAQLEPNFAAAGTGAIAAEADARLQAALEKVRAEALPLLRDAYKKRIGKDDSEPFRTHFIETDLPICETVTRLDQAIRSLQAYLDDAALRASDSPAAASPPYRSYEVWRGERMATFYPELRALWRDDVLAYEANPLDRGSIIFKHVVNNPQIRTDLQSAADAIKEAKAVEVDSTGHEQPFSFREIHGVFYADFERGFTTLDELLSANEAVQKSLVSLDDYEPGQALTHLSNASQHMDNLARLVFASNSQWITSGTGLGAYDRMAAQPLKQRSATLKALYDELISGPKAIFVPQNANIKIAGLLRGGLQSLNGWQADATFRLLDNGEIQTDGTGGSSIKQTRYAAAESRNFANYSTTIDFALTKRLLNGNRIGLGARLGSQGDRGYRLLITREVKARDDGDPITNSYLILERFDPNGIDELGRMWIRPEGVVEVNQEYLPIGDNFTIALHVYGSNIRGIFTLPSGQPVVVEAAEDAQFAKGTFAILAGGKVEADFSNLRLDFEGSGGWPPFYAHNRSQQKNRLPAKRYARHRRLRIGMSLSGLMPTRITFKADEDIKPKLEGAQIAGKQISLSFQEGDLAVDLDALDELFEKLLSTAFYLRYAVIPVRLAQAYQQAGDYERAAKMLRIVYDDAGRTESEREIYPALSAAPETFTQAVGADARLMRLRLGEAYLALAEWHFRKDTPESRYQARRVYERVLKLHTYSESCDCEAQLGEFTERVTDYVIDWLHNPNVQRLPIDDALGLIRSSINTDIPIRVDRLFDGRSKNPLAQANSNIADAVTTYRRNVRERATTAKLATKGASLLRQAELPAFAHLNIGRQPLRGSLAGEQPIRADQSISLLDVHTIDYSFCVPEAPLKSQQKRTACHMLQLLRTCRNILGFTNELLPPLRFDALLRLARNFTDLAQAAERDLLNFRQQFEQESFSLLQAQNTLVLSEAEFAVESMNLLVAESNVKIAGLQLQQADAAATHFQDLLAAGLSSAEKLALDSARWAATFSSLSAAVSLEQMAGSAVMAIATGGATGALPGGGDMAGGLSSLASAARDTSAAASLQAGYERRQQDWAFQLQQGLVGAAIAEESLSQATTRFAIAEQVQRIAGLRRDFAADAVQFLASKFLSSAMWIVLQGIMREQYRTRLNYAITAAFMAERALAFELQNRLLRVIRFDYFDPTRDGLLGATQLQTDLATLENTRLSFTQRKHQLSKTISLAQMMPIEFEIFRNGADLGDGQQRPAGLLRFGTLMEAFDRDFPGHYMRLIKAVKVTVVALIPPNDGIRATLRNNGLSRVVVGPPYSDTFREETIRRDPEAVALSLPFQATGLFVFDYKDDLLLPFEGTGVATDWVFELPKLANRFDYGTIADVLVTIEYTALESSDYRAQVLGQLGTAFAADRAISLRYEFADLWYDLHNPDQVDVANRMKAVLDVDAASFPPNLKRLAGVSGSIPGIKVQQIQFYLVRRDGETFELPVGLKFTPQNGSQVDAGTAVTQGGLISTRQPSGSGWQAKIAGALPVGRWEFDLTGNLQSASGQASADKIQSAFQHDLVEDVLFVITFEGETLPLA